MKTRTLWLLLGAVSVLSMGAASSLMLAQPVLWGDKDLGDDWAATSYTNPMPVQGGPADLTLTVTSGTSDTQDLGGRTVVAAQMPGSMTSTTFTWKCASSDGGTLYDIEDDSGAACQNAGVEANKVYAPASGACSLGVAACRHIGVGTGASESISITLHTK